MNSEDRKEIQSVKKRVKRKPKYTLEEVMQQSTILKSITETGNVLRAIGHANGTPRVGKETVKEAWKLVDQNRPQSEIKKVMIVASQMAAGSGKQTITVNNIRDANNLVLSLI